MKTGSQEAGLIYVERHIMGTGVVRRNVSYRVRYILYIHTCEHTEHFQQE